MQFKRAIAAVTGAVCAFTMFSVTAFAGTNELTGLEIGDEIINQRPVAIMVDNEKKALQHYGTGEADIVYEMMNSTANGRVTRLMCIYKDWANLQQTGSIRSVRTTNIMLADEYNAVLIHDGGPFYINSYFAQPYAAYISGGSNICFSCYEPLSYTDIIQFLSIACVGRLNPVRKNCRVNAVNIVFYKVFPYISCRTIMTAEINDIVSAAAAYNQSCIIAFSQNTYNSMFVPYIAYSC